MASLRKTYRRMPGPGLLRAGSNAAIWRGDDHLLLQSRALWTEHYRRFYFRDLHAVVVRRTRTWRTVGVASGAATLLALLVTGAGPLWARLAAAAIPATWFLLNLAMGPTCQTYLETASSILALPSLTRVRNARRFLRHLLPAVEEAQGVLSAAELRSRHLAILAERPDLLGQIPGFRAAPPGVVPPVASAPPPPPPPPGGPAA